MTTHTASQLTREDVAPLLDDKTWYLKVGDAEIVFYHAEGRSLAKWPDGKVRQGGRILNSDGSYNMAWSDTPGQITGSRLVGTPQFFTIIDVATGQPRGSVDRIVAGNPEGL